MVKLVKGQSWYTVEVDGNKIGTVKNFGKMGWISEDLKGNRHIKNTRKSAVEALVA